MKYVPRYVSSSSHGGMNEVVDADTNPSVYVSNVDYIALEQRLRQVEADAALWQAHKRSFEVLEKMLDVASPLILNKLLAQDAVRDAS